jgi:hypothetical protein
MNLFQRIFQKGKKPAKSQNMNPGGDTDEDMLIHEFSVLNKDNRLRKIMAAGDTGDLKYYDLIRYVVLQDPDAHVKFAALKRIHLFAAHPDLVTMLKKLQENKMGDTMEPYFSMALTRLGMMTAEDFEQKMNGVE